MQPNKGARRLAAVLVAKAILKKGGASLPPMVAGALLAFITLAQIGNSIDGPGADAVAEPAGQVCFTPDEMGVLK